MNNALISIRTQTRERLKEIGRKSQTYDDIINELIERKIWRKNGRAVLISSPVLESHEEGNRL